MSARTRHELAAIPLERASRLTGEQAAFAKGKRARDNGQPDRSCPMGPPSERAAWMRGYLFQDAHRRGLLPLDTARRIAS